MIFKRKLPIPQEVKAEYPLSDELAAIKAKNDSEIRKIFTGKSDKFLLVIGPCSADREDAVMEYIHKLKRLSEQVEDKLLIIPR
ncbi:MAG: 3-deoxy-7-phosphoheptulonate synthase, partial [Clostridia bacterium]|nr:3-deoxy-7-phosphoheptulonate synthase [Clostridia bacterium]